MFRRRPDTAPAATVLVTVEGRDIRVPEGASAAAAVLLAGLSSIRETPVSDAPRAPYCLMGICFDCLVEIDGIPNRQSCMITVAPGMTIRRQHGKRAVAAKQIDGAI
jgi:predicted molibdopterin-dependent oxidoreductase YjgC